MYLIESKEIYQSKSLATASPRVSVVNFTRNYCIVAFKEVCLVNISRYCLSLGHKCHYERLRTPYERFSDNGHSGRQLKKGEIRTNLCDRSIISQ